MANETAFLVNFLPVIRRTLTPRAGFVIDHVLYFSDEPKAWITRRGRSGPVRDLPRPRDISRI